MNSIEMNELEKEARYYQIEAVDIAFDIVMNHKNRHPIIALPTGTGKSFVFSLFIDKVLSHDPKHNILILCDREEILSQDHEELEEYFGLEIGLYSTGLESQTIKKITVAGIQSIYKKAELFKRFDIVIIDECDSVNENNNSMYRKFLSGLDAVYIGATATPYGLKGGYLHEGENSLFTEICIDYTRGEKYLKLVDDKYLPTILAKPTSVKFDDKKLSTLAGDFSLKDQSAQFDIDSITKAAMMEVVYYGKNFKRWLIFAIDIKHAENISRILTEMNVSNCVLHSKMEGDRKKILKESKSGKYRAVINVDILTIGYNDRKIDLVALLFCTKSPRKHVQTSGRLRYDEETPYKIVLDFGGNFKRLGPLNDVKIKKIGEKKGEGGAMMKECPECTILNHLSAKICCNCEYEFPQQVKVTKKADFDVEAVKKSFDIPKVDKGGKEWWAVDSVNYERYSKPGKPDMLRVKYKCGMRIFSHWVAIESDGYPFYLAKNWISFRWNGNGNPPNKVSEIINQKDQFNMETEILVDTTGKYPAIKDSRF